MLRRDILAGNFPDYISVSLLANAQTMVSNMRKLPVAHALEAGYKTSHKHQVR